MNVYFMRHGETDWNKEQRIQGSTDIPLNQNGIDLAEETAKNLFKDGITFRRIYTSPLIRAQATAQIMNRYSGAQIKLDERIREFGFGQAEGATYAELRTQERFAHLKNWFLNPAEYKAELGAESYEDFFGRISDFLENEIKPLEGKTDDVLIVCHGGVVRGLLKVMCNWSVLRFSETKIPNCGINLVTLNDGIFTVQYTARTF